MMNEVGPKPVTPPGEVEVAGATGDEAVTLKQLKTTFDKNGTESLQMQESDLSTTQYTVFPLSGVSLKAHGSIPASIIYMDTQAGLFICGYKPTSGYVRTGDIIISLEEPRSYGEIIPISVNAAISRSKGADDYHYVSYIDATLEYTSFYSVSWFIPKQN